MRSLLALYLTVCGCAPDNSAQHPDATARCWDDSQSAIPPDGPRTHGAFGGYALAWDSFPAASFDRPLATGAHQYVYAYPILGPFGAPPAIHGAVTSDPSIATATFAGGPGLIDPAPHIYVEAHAPGETTLRLLDDQGHVVDAAYFFVADVDNIELAGNWSRNHRVMLVKGVTQRMRVRLYHGADELVGWGVTRFSFGGVVVRGDQLQAPSELLPGTEEVFFVANAPGAGTITAAAGSATTTLPVSAVELAAIDNIDISLASNDGLTSHCEQAIAVTPRLGNATVYGPPCDWGAGVEHVAPWRWWPWSDDGGWPGEHDAQMYRVVASAFGDYRVRCTIGGATADLSLTFPR